MSLPKCTTNTNVIENLPDAPTLPANELKKKFDEAVTGIKQYINEILDTELDRILANKVEKIIGKGLSTNDYTNEEMNKLDIAVKDIEDLKGTTLFDYPNGDNSGSITLNDSISNYNEIKIDYVVAIGDYRISESKKIPAINGTSVALECLIAHSPSVQLLHMGRYLISETSVTRTHETRSRITSSATVAWDGNSTGIYITKITGYKD